MKPLVYLIVNAAEGRRSGCSVLGRDRDAQEQIVTNWLHVNLAGNKMWWYYFLFGLVWFFELDCQRTETARN